jgi:Rrf2 family transcriptional regulator, iron-sulfur cluster assembly transcription factor
MRTEILSSVETCGRCAVAALLDLALHEQDGPVALIEISQRLHLSMSYLERIFKTLNNCGLVHGMRGPGGGYSLGRPASELSVADIVLALARTRKTSASSAMARLRSHYASEAGRIVDNLVLDLNGIALDYLASLSLQDLMDSALPSTSLKQKTSSA